MDAFLSFMLEVSGWGSTLTAHDMTGSKVNLATSHHPTGGAKMTSTTTVVGGDLAQRVPTARGREEDGRDQGAPADPFVRASVENGLTTDLPACPTPTERHADR